MNAAAEIAKRLSCGESGCGCGKEISPGTWRTHCPLPHRHNNGDANPSLDITDGPDGKLLFYCQSQNCSFSDIVAALKAKGIDISRSGDRPQVGSGLTMADFAAAKKLDPTFLAKHGVTQATGKEESTILVFNYRDVTGRTLKKQHE